MPSTLVALTMSLAGCHTPQLEHQRADRMRPIVGMTMAEFSRYTGLTSVDEYDIEGGRVFVLLGYDTREGFGASGAPAYADALNCRMLLLARSGGEQNSLPGWQIDEVQWLGACANGR